MVGNNQAIMPVYIFTYLRYVDSYFCLTTAVFWVFSLQKVNTKWPPFIFTCWDKKIIWVSGQSFKRWLQYWNSFRHGQSAGNFCKLRWRPIVPIFIYLTPNFTGIIPVLFPTKVVQTVRIVCISRSWSQKISFQNVFFKTKILICNLNVTIL